VRGLGITADSAGARPAKSGNDLFLHALSLLRRQSHQPRGHFKLDVDIDVNCFGALKHAAKVQEANDVSCFDWAHFTKGIELVLNFRNHVELLCTKTLEWLGDNDDRSMLFNPVGNYQSMFQAAVANAPTKLALAHMAPVLQHVCNAFFNKVDSVCGLRMVTSTLSLDGEVTVPGLVPALKDMLGFDEAWPQWECANEEILNEVIGMIDRNGNGQIPLDEAEVFCAVLEQLNAEQAASDLRDLYAEQGGLEVPSSIFAIPVAMAAYGICKEALTSSKEPNVVKNPSPEQARQGFELIKAQLQSVL